MKKLSILCLVLLILTIILFSSPYISELNIIRLHEKVMILQEPSSGLNMTVIDAGDCLVVVDTFASPVVAARARDLIEKEFQKPITYVFNTHYHWDHTFGNEVFKEAIIVGHRLCAEDMRREYTRISDFVSSLEKRSRQSAAKQDQIKASWLRTTARQLRGSFCLTPPNLLVNDRYVLHICDLTVKLYHVPGIHSRSNLTIYIPELGLVFTRGCFHQSFFPLLRSGVDMGKLCSSLEDILLSGKEIRHIIPGHGDALTDPRLNICLNYLKQLENTVTYAKTMGMSFSEAKEIFDGSGYPVGQKMHVHHERNMKLLWEEWEAKKNG